MATQITSVLNLASLIFVVLKAETTEIKGSTFPEFELVTTLQRSSYDVSYYISTMPEIWNNAYFSCISNSFPFFAATRSSNDDKLLGNYLKKKGIQSAWLAGAHKDGSWSWARRNSLGDNTYLPYCHNSWSKYERNASCATSPRMALRSNGDWECDNSTVSKYFFCENSTLPYCSYSHKFESCTASILMVSFIFLILIS